TIRSQAFDQAADPMVHQYNFNIQYQLTDSLTLSASYSGLLGRDLSSMFINVNQLPFSAALQGLNKQADRPFPNINGTVIPVFSNGTNNYNSLNFRVDKSFSKGFALLVNYTIQKNLQARRVDGARHDSERDRCSDSTIRDRSAAGRARAGIEKCRCVRIQELQHHGTLLFRISSGVVQCYQHTDILPTRRQQLHVDLH